jgi:hypothetical protein
MIEREQPGLYREVSEADLKAYHAKMAQQAKQEADPWVHRSSGMRCRTCLWFVRKEPTGPQSHPGQHEIGRCRRHAPTMGGYPVVYMTDWCGDHRLDENKI